MWLEKIFSMLWTVYPLCFWFPLLSRSFVISCSHPCQCWDCCLCGCGLFRKPLPCLCICSELYSLCFSLAVSVFQLRSLIHFKLILVQDERYRSNFVILKVDIQFCQHHLLNRMNFSMYRFLTPLSKLGAWVYFWAVRSVPLVCFYGHITFPTYNYESISWSHENAALGQLNSGLPAEWIRGECLFTAVNYLKIIFRPDMPQIRMTVPLSRVHTSIGFFFFPGAHLSAVLQTLLFHLHPTFLHCCTKPITDPYFLTRKAFSPLWSQINTTIH